MAKEYIERGRLLSTLKDNRPLNWTNTNDEVVEQICYDDFESIVKNQPTADVQEVRHGEWLEDDYGYCHCSNCRYEHDSPECITPYCPECGAKMDKE